MSIFIENFKEPVSKWLVSHSREGWPSTRIGFWVWYETEVSSVHRGLFGLRPTLRYSYTSTVDSFHDAYSVEGWRPSDLLEQEFGADWEAMRHPDFQARILPSIEDAITEDMFELADDDALGPPITTAGFANAGSLIVESDGPADRWEVIPKLFTGTIPLWIFLSVGLIAFTFVSRERKANRWLAGRCPKCGYPRSSIREDCAECGLRYERPSHVTWDPKNGKVEP